MSRDLMPKDASPAVVADPGDWCARRLTDPPALDAPGALPGRDTTAWIPLARHRRAGEAAGGAFNRGWAQIGWTASGLAVDFVFASTGARNRAQRLNERTHLLGDTGEIFLQCAGSDRYVEIHVTPENQRLQLAWDSERLEAVRQGRAALEDFTIAESHWVRSVTRITPTFWSARALVPVDTFRSGAGELTVSTALRAAVCRYDAADEAAPVLSSTADFHGRPFRFD